MGSENLEKNGVHLNPLEMPEMIEKILNFCTLDDLKSIRQTSKLWSCEATSIALKKYWICVPSEFCSEKFTIPPETFDDILIAELNDAFHTNFPTAGFLNPDNPDHVLFRSIFESEFRTVFQNEVHRQETRRQEKAGHILSRLFSPLQKTEETPPPSPTGEENQINFESTRHHHSHQQFNLSMEDFTQINFFAGVPFLPLQNARMLAIGYCKCFLEYGVVEKHMKNLKKFLSHTKNIEILEAPLSLLTPDFDWPDSEGADGGGVVIGNFLRFKYGLTKLRAILAAAECHTISSSTVEGFLTFQTKFGSIVNKIECEKRKKKKHSKNFPAPKIQWKMAPLRLELQSTDSLPACRHGFEQLADHLKHLKISFHDYDDDEEFLQNNLTVQEIQNQHTLNLAKTDKIWLDNWYLPLSLQCLQTLSIDCCHHHVDSRKFHAIALQLPRLKKFEISALAIIPLPLEEEEQQNHNDFGFHHDGDWRGSKSLESLTLEFPRASRRLPACMENFEKNYYPFFKLYPNLKNLKINLTTQMASRCPKFTRAVLGSIFLDARNSLEGLDLMLENNVGTGKMKMRDQAVRMASWDELLLAAGAEDGCSIKSLTELKRLTIRINGEPDHDPGRGREDGWMARFIYEGLMMMVMGLKNLQSVHIVDRLNCQFLTTAALNDLRETWRMDTGVHD